MTRDCFQGKNSLLKEKFESGVFDEEEEEEEDAGDEGKRRRKSKEQIKIEGKRTASALMKKFERGEPFILEDEEGTEEGEEEEEEEEGGAPRLGRRRRIGSEKKEVEEIFKEAGKNFEFWGMEMEGYWFPFVVKGNWREIGRLSGRGFEAGH